MKPRRYSSEGIVLTRRNYGEADRIIIVFSKHYGKISLLAKGVRKPKSRKRGHLEVFSRFKFSASRTKGLDIITEAEILDSFQNIRKDLKKTTVAYFFMEAIERLLREEEKNHLLYKITLSYLRKLQTPQRILLRKLRHDFVYRSLVVLGFWPKGKIMQDADGVLREITEKDLSSIRVAKKMLR